MRKKREARRPSSYSSFATRALPRGDDSNWTNEMSSNFDPPDCSRVSNHPHDWSPATQHFAGLVAGSFGREFVQSPSDSYKAAKSHAPQRSGKLGFAGRGEHAFRYAPEIRGSRNCKSARKPTLPPAHHLNARQRRAPVILACGKNRARIGSPTFSGGSRLRSARHSPCSERFARAECIWKDGQWPRFHRVPTYSVGFRLISRPTACSLRRTRCRMLSSRSWLGDFSHSRMSVCNLMIARSWNGCGIFLTLRTASSSRLLISTYAVSDRERSIM
jgi:hypothetical protein